MFTRDVSCAVPVLRRSGAALRHVYAAGRQLTPIFMRFYHDADAIFAAAPHERRVRAEALTLIFADASCFDADARTDDAQAPMLYAAIDACA